VDIASLSPDIRHYTNVSCQGLPLRRFSGGKPAFPTQIDPQ
jgi:hypothetical protein